MSMSATAADDTPPQPSWVREDGTVDMSKMPESMPVMGPDGEPLKDASGKQVMVKTEEDKPVEPQALPETAPNSLSENGKTWVETDENGVTTEVQEIEPSIPAGD
ncbi:hypothetical protein G6048_11225 [Streptomyces sp. YC419]|uniref:Uncharacterized protein n=2 Tax=Streptomyces ureilyticus TaxID=1775131 RepID=A0ABX0DME6_9ACTN|nr:hypothetical protein [Streptomyces ureilyticus]